MYRKNKVNELKQPITAIKGIGDETAALLEELNIFTIEDLLMYLPYRYEDYRIRDLADVNHDEKVTVEGVVASEPSLTYYGRKKSRIIVRLMVGNVLITAVLFNQAYMKNKISLNQQVTVSGKWNRHRQQITVSSLRVGSQAPAAGTDFLPVYSVKGDVTVRGIRRFIQLAFDQFGHLIVDNLPEYIRTKYRLYHKYEAIRAMHFPKNAADLKQARRRMVYEEFLLFQLKMQALRKFERENSKGISILYNNEQLKKFIDSLPYSLTNAQKRVLKEIFADIRSPYRMNRLLQGDVGSGKTAVAAIALYATVTSGYQGALMVPTEILAEQHAQSLTKMLQPFGIEVGLLTSSIKKRDREGLLERLKDGSLQIFQ